MVSLSRLLLATCLLTCSPCLRSQSFDLTQPQPLYSEGQGYGYDICAAPQKNSQTPFYFSVRVPDGNYRVRVTLGSRRRASQTMVRAESRRLMVEEVKLKKGATATITFLVNKRSPRINDGQSVALKPREHTYLNWDDRLTLEFNGSAPAVQHITVERDTVAPTVFLCGNSTVVDQESEPYASWGQMVPRWFGDRVCIANYGESGLTAGTFLGQRRLDKVLAELKPGDYVFCEFGHNDQKEHRAGDGAWYHFAHNLKIFIDRVREAGGRILFLTPTQRRSFDDSRQHIKETHLDYPDAMRAVAKREGVPVIELHDMTRTFFETLGFEGSKRSLVHYPAGTYPGQDKPLADNTHFNPYGAYEVAKMVVAGIQQLDASFADVLQRAVSEDFMGYDPAHPDDPDSFQWPSAIITDTTKPDGN
ncbi:MAG: rhamnogalacturonan acetylesterase [Bacteroidaceae bacterium]|nr:rhamnogalacturonan acetylesterase [Bacteroidaceae bacterium]